MCFKCKLVMSPVAGGEHQCTLCSSRESFSPAEDAEMLRMFKQSAKELIRSWFFDKCCRVGMHAYEDNSDRSEQTSFDLFKVIPISVDVRFRICTYCDKEQRMDWLIWQDIHKIPLARVLSEKSSSTKPSNTPRSEE
jgi:hypothetical protein